MLGVIVVLEYEFFCRFFLRIRGEVLGSNHPPLCLDKVPQSMQMSYIPTILRFHHHASQSGSCCFGVVPKCSSFFFFFFSSPIWPQNLLPVCCRILQESLCKLETGLQVDLFFVLLLRDAHFPLLAIKSCRSSRVAVGFLGSAFLVI